MKLSNKGHWEMVWDMALPHVASISVFFYFNLILFILSSCFLVVLGQSVPDPNK